MKRKARELADQAAVRQELAEQHAALAKQNRQFDEWTAARREELDEHAARLVAREAALQHERGTLEEQHHQWQAERLDYEQQLRRLRARLAETDRELVAA